MRYLLICGMLLAGVIFHGCAHKATDEEAELKTVVAKYNNALIEAYKNQFFAPLQEVTSEDEFRKVNIVVSSFLQGSRIMESELHRLDFKEIKIEKDEARVRTSEDWSYRWVNYRTRQEIEPLKEIRYEMLYHLVKKNNKWLVDKVEEVKGDNPSAKGRP
ncbi:MAG: hypothetical protein HZC16_02565 [Candidatus Omnitrophica bacterium]|nr:hypothetical protein [Candidatus Omnitrophota bacterium]